MPRFTSIVKNPHVLVPDRFFHPSGGHVSDPASPGRGTVWKVQISLPVFASQPRMSPYAPALGEPSPLLHPVMTTSPNTAGGESNSYRPSFRSPSTPFFRSTRPSSPNPGAGLPVVTSSANRKYLLPANTRACRPPAPGQYARPRRATGDAPYFHSN